MGAITFSIDNQLIEWLTSEHHYDAFVETGTFQGDTVEIVKDYFPKIYSIELSTKYYEEAKKRFINDDKIVLIFGDAADNLKNISLELAEKKTVYWLDAHWCVASDTAGISSQCNLVNELAAIRNLNTESIIIIDDARLFLCAPSKPHEISQWPTFQSVLNNLQTLSDKHGVSIINDTIIFYPEHMEDKFSKFAQEHGVDWLSYVDKSKSYDQLLIQLNEKEKEIVLLNEACKAREKELSAKGDIIDNLHVLTNNHIEKGSLLQEKELQEKENVINVFLEKIKTEQLEFFSILEKNNQNNLENINLEMREVIKKIDDCRAMLIASQNRPVRKTVSKIKNRSKNTAKKIKNRSGNYAKKIKTLSRPQLGRLHQYTARPFQIQHTIEKELIKYPKISIVTPSYQQAEYIKRTIHSILDQKYPNLQYVIQDGNSTDGTKEILSQYHSQLTHWESVPDKGQSNAINLGFQHTDGEIMAYLNSDDLLLPGSLHYIANYFLKNPNIDVVYGHRVLIDKNDMEIGRWILPRHSNKILQWVDYVPQETLFWRRSIWEKVGGQIDENFQFAMDWDLILRFIEAGAKFKRLPRFLGAFRVHEHQKTSTVINDKGLQEMNILRERCHGREVTVKEIHKNIKKYFIKHLLCQNLYKLRIFRYGT